MLDYHTAREWLEEAGKLAMEGFRKVKPVLKDNETYVTEADIAVQNFLTAKIEEEYPHVGLLGEENDLKRAPSSGDYHFVIDPIDGTASFVSGLPIWGIAFGVLKAHQPVAGYFYMPASSDFFHVESKGAVYRNGSVADMRPSEDVHRESLILTVSRIHKRYRINAAYPGKVRSLGSTIAHICYTATGSADAALVGGCNIWDLAAGLAMLYRNGGSACYVNGDPFSIDADLLAGEKLPMPVLFGRHSAVQYFLENISYEP